MFWCCIPGKINTVSHSEYRENRHYYIAEYPSVKTIKPYAFFRCYNLKTAKFPSATKIEKWAFGSCDSLITANFPRVERMRERAFISCRELKTADFPLLTKVEEYAFLACRKLEITRFPLVKTIKRCAFSGCYKLKTVDFPQVTTIQTKAFDGCMELRTAYFPKATIIGDGAFSECDKLSYIVLPEALSREERQRIGLSNNTIVIAAKDFDPSLLQFSSPDLIAKLYSQGPHIAKALLSMVRAELTSWGTLIEILKGGDFKKHSEIDTLVKSMMEQSDDILYSDKQNEQAEINKTKSENQQPNTKLLDRALTIFSLHMYSKTDKNYRKSQESLGHVDALKEELLSITKIDKKEMDGLKQYYEASLMSVILTVSETVRETVLAAIDLPSPAA